MTVTVEPLAIGNLAGPRVWLVCRRVGGHLDVEEAPDSVTSESEAQAWAAQRWRVPECEVTSRPVQVVDVEP